MTGFTTRPLRNLLLFPGRHLSEVGKQTSGSKGPSLGGSRTLTKKSSMWFQNLCDPKPHAGFWPFDFRDFPCFPTATLESWETTFGSRGLDLPAGDVETRVTKPSCGFRTGRLSRRYDLLPRNKRISSATGPLTNRGTFSGFLSLSRSFREVPFRGRTKGAWVGLPVGEGARLCTEQ